MKTRDVLIGTGFYSNGDDHKAKVAFFDLWEWNTQRVSRNIVVVDNSTKGFATGLRDVRIFNNLGHIADGDPNLRLLGWSMSWIIPATIAYSDGCDFVYKEQDCLAFGDWLPEIRRPSARMTFGTHKSMPCEQSLFWIQCEFIPEFISAYCGIPNPDAALLPEVKFAALEKEMQAIERFAMPCGRDRPMTLSKDKPWYVQKITEPEYQQLGNWGFI